MKSLILFIFISSIITTNITQTKSKLQKPYEATWMELTKTDSGYIIYNYPNLNFNMQSPFKMIFKNDTLTRITYYDTIRIFSCENTKNLDNEKFYFPVGNHYQFEWFDKEKHIARWIIFNGYGEIQNNNLYIDSLYNTFPIVDFVWEEE